VNARTVWNAVAIFSALASLVAATALGLRVLEVRRLEARLAALLSHQSALMRIDDGEAAEVRRLLAPGASYRAHGAASILTFAAARKHPELAREALSRGVPADGLRFEDGLPLAVASE
jgi:hypothetical protein